jgi:hypothetical protein
MANRSRLLGFAFAIVALLYCSGVASQGLTYVAQTSWPWRSSNVTDIYTREPFIKGDAGMYFSRRPIGVPFFFFFFFFFFEDLILGFAM